MGQQSNSNKLIQLSHFCLTKKEFVNGLRKETRNVAGRKYSTQKILEITNPNYDFFLSKLDKIDPRLFWNHQYKLKDLDNFEKIHLLNEGCRFFTFWNNGQEVGFSVIRNLQDYLNVRLHRKIFNTQKGPMQDIKDIDYFAMYHGKEGFGLGKIYMEMLLGIIFHEENKDAVLVTSHSTNHKNVPKFYMNKIGMRFIEKDIIHDFRPVDATIETDFQGFIPESHKIPRKDIINSY